MTFNRSNLFVFWHTGWFLSICFVCFFSGNAQDSVSHHLEFEADIRERFEIWNGMNMLNYGDGNPSKIGRLNDKILFQRVILGFAYKYNDKILMVVRMQDSRAPGWSLRNALEPDAFRIPKSVSTEYYIMNPGEEFFELRDAFICAKFPDTSKTLEVKVGRQKIFFGDDRVFGPADWGNTGRWTWDAIRFDFVSDRLKASLFAGGTKVNDPRRFSVPYRQLEFLGGGFYAEYRFDELLKLEPFYALKLPGTADYARTLTFQKHWAGFRIFGENVPHLLFDATFAYMFGQQAGRRIDASGHVIKVGYHRTIQSFRGYVSLRHTYGSGGPSNRPVLHTFESPYGGIEKFLGRMNIFQWSNVEDRELMFELKHKNGFRTELSVHLFYLPHRRSARLLNSLKSDNESHYAGYEIDLFVQHRIVENIQTTLVMGMFVPQHLLLLNGDKPKRAYMLALQLHYQFRKQLFQRHKQ